MEFDELMNELVSLQDVDWILEDAVNLNHEKEGVFSAWECWNPSEFGCLSPSSGLVFPDPGDVQVKDAYENSTDDENAKDSEFFSGDCPPLDDVSLGVSSPGSDSGSDEECKAVPSSDLDTKTVCPDGSVPELKEVSSDSQMSADSCLELKSLSPESGFHSFEEQAQGRSSNQSANRGTASEEDTTVPMDEETKRRIRLMRNRESATQSRLRKKSYIKELEIKCRMLESHCSMLQQTVAFTSRENVLLRDELNKIKCSNMNGSKYGVVEPAALPSDSLPSESPQRLTAWGPFRFASWELLVCLYLALLLAVLGTKVRSRGRGGKRERRLWYRIKRRQVREGSVPFTTLISLGRLRWQLMSVGRKVFSCSRRAKKRDVVYITNETSTLATRVYQRTQYFPKRRKHTRNSGRRWRRYGHYRHR